MASLGLLLLAAALISAAQTLPAGHGQGRGFDVSVGGARRHRRHAPDLLQYEDKMMFYPSTQTKGGADDLLYQPQAWGDRGLGQALQRLVERDQRREQEEDQKAAYLAALLRLLSSAEGAGMWDVEVLEDEEDNQEDVVPDYDETGRGLSFGRPPAGWQSLMEPRLAEALLDRMDLQLFQSLLQRAGKTRDVPPRRSSEQDALRRLVARILSTAAPRAPRTRLRTAADGGRGTCRCRPPNPSARPPRLSGAQRRPPPSQGQKARGGG
ncbi:hypothetical protein OJAV_G00071770 [Oryzias javanicus]|uniref:Uncharacterized protein n=1 Tax=Oryzias javanicus TaxID=123683 RepID=A0A3S2UHL3_ORYJA|nr:hypothetical protein OJAV_G00071770 [Oryzias javanicus]